MTVLEFLTECALKGSVLLLAGFAAGVLLRRKSAALRHTIWTISLAAMLVLPVAVLTLPSWGVLARRPAPRPVPVVAVPSANVTVTTAPAEPLPPRFNIALVVWLSGAGFVALWFLTGILRTSWMVRRATPTGGDAELAASLGIRRLRVLSSDATAMPLAWGVLRPVVVLPRGAGEWPDARRRTVLLHEMIHVQRLDVLAQWIGQAACCLYWFHPMVWLAARRLRNDREQACDDAVLARGISAPEYAGHLMDLVRSLAARRNVWQHAPAMAEVSGLETRVRALLDSKRDRRPVNRRKGLVIASSGAALLLPLAALSQTPSAPVAAPAAPAVSTPPEAAPAPVPQTPARKRKPVLIAEAAAPEPQTVSGSVTGTVRDPSGAVVPNCSVHLRNADGYTNTAQTGSDGQYRFDYVPAGRYALQIQAAGFATSVRSVEISGSRIARINVGLELGTVSTTVEVSGRKPASAPAQTAEPQRIRVGGMVEQPKLVRQPRPQYPAELQQAGVEGTVSLRAIISKEGIPMSLRPVSSSVDSRLVPLAMDAVAQWRYTPALLNGEPVETVTTIDVNFTLNQ